jgi:hypothetical protein
MIRSLRNEIGLKPHGLAPKIVNFKDFYLRMSGKY